MPTRREDNSQLRPYMAHLRKKSKTCNSLLKAIMRNRGILCLWFHYHHHHPLDEGGACSGVFLGLSTECNMKYILVTIFDLAGMCLRLRLFFFFFAVK